MSRILVVEDEAALRAFVVRALRLDGHEVVEREDGEAGLEAMSGSDQPFDLVLSDIRMPVMDGIEMAMQMAKNHPDTPILLMTGYAEQRERAVELQGIVRGVVEKPFTLDAIRQAVAKALTA